MDHPHSAPTTAIIGAGVAGCRLAQALATRGRKVLLFDPRAPWEKPCGGGLTAKVFQDFPELRAMDLDGREHHRLELVFPSSRRARLTLPFPLVTVSRQKLGAALLAAAIKAGGNFRPEKVTALTRQGPRWEIRTAASTYVADILVGADGVTGLVRKTVAQRFPRADLCLTYSALLPPEPSLPLILKFFAGFQGYAWIFPRQEATSVGLALENGGAKGQDLRQRLAETVASEYQRAGLPVPALPPFTARLLPALRPTAFADPVVNGENWALIGDASGAADPLTGEGIYYALKTAALLAPALVAGNLKVYEAAWKGLCAASIANVSEWREKFYRPQNLRRLAFLLDYSPAVRDLTRDLICGQQRYDTLRGRVKMDLGQYFRQAIWNRLWSRKGDLTKPARPKTDLRPG